MAGANNNMEDTEIIQTGATVRPQVREVLEVDEELTEDATRN